MSTETLSMQSFGGFRGHEFELDLKLASDISTLYGTQDDWAPASYGNEPRAIGTNYMRFPVPSASTSVNSQPEYANTTTNSDFDASTSYSSPSMFTAANTMAQAQNTTTVSPLQTRFDSDESSPHSYSSSTFDDPNTRIPTKFIEHSAKCQQVPIARGSNNSQTRNDSQSPTAKQPSIGRRRRSECAEAGSARAIYLEKNRQAASKCRNKQKRQQEELVEEARDIERRNKLLKVEVDMLRGGIRELMNVVAQHADCPDSRLQLYVQREADRLATGGMRIFSYPQSSEMPPTTHGLLSPDASSSPGKQ